MLSTAACSLRCSWAHQLVLRMEREGRAWRLKLGSMMSWAEAQVQLVRRRREAEAGLRPQLA